MDQFGKTDQIVSKICANENATVEKRLLHTMHRLDAFSEVGVRRSLPERVLVVNLPYPLDERVIEERLPDDDPFLLTLLCFVSGLESDLLRPPVVEGGYWQCREVVPLHRVGIFW